MLRLWDARMSAYRSKSAGSSFEFAASNQTHPRVWCAPLWYNFPMDRFAQIPKPPPDPPPEPVRKLNDDPPDEPEEHPPVPPIEPPPDILPPPPF